MPHSKPDDDPLFDLPEVPADYLPPPLPPPTWEEQMAHAPMLLRWQNAQGVVVPDPPRNPEPFIFI